MQVKPSHLLPLGICPLGQMEKQMEPPHLVPLGLQNPCPRNRHSYSITTIDWA